MVCFFVYNYFMLLFNHCAMQVRLFDSRFFHEFGSPVVLLDVEKREATLEELQGRIPRQISKFTDPNAFSRFVPLKNSRSVRIELQSTSPQQPSAQS
jgi:hypothetical protein